MKNYKEALKHKIFDVISLAGKDLELESYVIGGFVRDFILDRGDAKDIDVVAVGSGIELARQVSKRLSHKPKVQVFKNYGTAMLRAYDLEIEFVGARGKATVRTAGIRWWRTEPWKTIKTAGISP